MHFIKSPLRANFKNQKVMFSRKKYLDKLIAHKHNHQIKVVTGIRRSGKSYLLFNIFYKHLIDSGVAEDHIIKIDLEDRRNKSLRDPDTLLSYIDNCISDNEMYYILLDEVQLVDEFEDVLNSYLKVTNADVYVTGSNSRFLSKDIITNFRGRGDEIHIYPLSIKEICEVQTDLSWQQAWEAYLHYGGLPFCVLLPSNNEKVEYLKRLFSETYLKDIKERYDVINDLAMEQLLDIISSSIGSLTNPQKLENSFLSLGKIRLSAPTIKQYLNYFEDAFLIHRSDRYDIKGKKYISTPYKYYFTDMGLRNARLNFRQIEETHIMENIIYNELLLRGYSVDVGVVIDRRNGGYVQKEVDFVVNHGDRKLYIQSAFQMGTEQKEAAELDSLKLTGDFFKKIVIRMDIPHNFYDDNGIFHCNLIDFLLERVELF